jgi:hypothetical protein|nr:MAG TPA: hypothetical protein [Caudoviricetes sp.]
MSDMTKTENPTNEAESENKAGEEKQSSLLSGSGDGEEKNEGTQKEEGGAKAKAKRTTLRLKKRSSLKSTTLKFPKE